MKRRHSIRLIVLILCSLLGISVAPAADWAYTVRPGDNLWTITERYLKDIRYVTPLQRHNGIEDPYNVPPGTRIRIPVRWSVFTPRPAVAAQVAGDVQVRVDTDSERRRLEAGSELEIGSEITTGENGSALIRFADGSELALKPNSTLSFDTLSAFGDSGMVDSRVRLSTGRLEFGVKRKPEGESHFEVTTPAATIAVRGTQFRASADAERPVARTEVTAGGVAVTAAGKTRAVPGEFGVVIEKGKAPPPPVRLLPPPELSELPGRFEQIAFNLRWPAVERATGYRAQIATSEGFETIIFDRTSARPRIGVSGLGDGDYFVRVRAIDHQALEGLDADAAFVLDARPQPPVIVSPLPDEIVRVSEPLLSWAVTEGAAGYHVEVARDVAFSDIVVREEGLKAARFPPGVLADGDYFWRVGLTDRTGDRGPFSPPSPFRVRRPPLSPTPGPPAFEDDKMTFAWAGIEGFRYVFQLARDKKFEIILVNRIVDEPKITMRKFIGGRYYLRIATIDETGYRSPFGPPAHVNVPLF